MKTAIINYLRENPNQRRRVIASAVGVWQADAEFLRIMYELRDAGLIVERFHQDMANMVAYYTYSIKE